MSQEFIVDQALCMCQYGVAPGKIMVTDQSFFFMNGSKLVATTMTIGNAMYPPGFGSCKINPMFPKPCMPAIVQWSNPFQKLQIGQGSYAITNQSKGTCASGGTDCIQFLQSGQIPVPGVPKMKEATAEQQESIDPVGEPAGLDTSQEQQETSPATTRPNGQEPTPPKSFIFD